MPLLVAAATALELKAALGVETTALAAQGEVFEVSAYGRPVLALITGLGVINAALALGRALGRALTRGGVTGVLNFGVAGSFDLAAHPLGAVRLIERETWPEYGLLLSGAVAADARALGFALDGEGAAAIFEHLAWDAPAELSRMDLLPGALPRGWDSAQSLTVSGVTADPARAGELFRRFGAGLENMEGFALAYAARLAGAPFAELRSVSNAVGSRPPKDWDLPGALKALGQAAELLLKTA